MESDVMPEPQFSAESGKDKPDEVMPDEVMLKDVLKPSNLIIALIVSVLFILLGWYLLVLKPALSESFPMDIRLTKKPFSITQFSQELKYKTEVETQLTSDHVEPSNEAFEIEEKESVQRINPTRHTKSTQRNTSRKSAKSNIAKNEKEPTAQSQDFSRLQNKHEDHDKKEEITKAEDYVRAAEDKDEDTAQKIKSLAVKWKESFLTPATQPICTQVQIAMNQCRN